MIFQVGSLIHRCNIYPFLLGDHDEPPSSPGPIVVTDTDSSSSASSDTSDDINSISSDDSSQHLNAIFRTNTSDLNLDSDDSSFIDWQL